MSKQLSIVAESNLYTMGICADKDARQRIPGAYGIPDEDIRRLRAKLILEEAIETVHGLGFDLVVETKGLPPVIIPDHTHFVLARNDAGPDLEKIIDGCCDTVYVCIGALCSCGAPDLPHLIEVCGANNSKFPDGQAIFNASGKYLKPEGWVPPNHIEVMQQVSQLGLSLSEEAKAIKKEILS